MTNFLRHFFLSLWVCGATGLAAVRVEEVPENGVQPEVAVSSDGVVHLVYLRGEPGAAEVRYTWRKPGQEWQPGRTVNTDARRAVAVGSIRGPQLALGMAGSVHVIWNGVAGAKGVDSESPLWYTRKSGAAESFELERDLLGGTTALDGGASVAANGRGLVMVAWHAHDSGKDAVETNRLVFVRLSDTDGISFAEAEGVNRRTAGVCACCSLRASFDPAGALGIFYRNVVGSDHRAMTLLSRTDAGWQSREIEPWETSACPMSSASTVAHPNGLLGVWETAGAIRAGWVSKPGSPAITVASVDARHPAASISGQGNIVIAWTEGSGWNKGGIAAWQEFDAQLKARGLAGRREGVPAWGRVAVYAEPDGGFVVLR